MKILSRYLLSEFLRPLAFIVVSFVGLYVIAQLVDDVRSFVTHHPPLVLILLYYLFRLPYYTVQVMPLAVQLSALISLGQLARHNELIAMRSCGISFLRIAFPILFCSLVISLGVMGFNELVIPRTNPRAEYIRKVKIEQRENTPYAYRRERVTRSASGNRVLFMRSLDAQLGKIERAIYLELDSSMNIRRRLDAPRAEWQEGSWIFQDGVVRDFDPAGRLLEVKSFQRLGVPFKETPREFIREEKNLDQLLSMSARELRRNIELLKETGSSAAKEEVNLQLKFSFPFANFILALLGVSLPFIFPSGRRALVGAAIGFVITLATGFFYIGFIAVGTSFGNNGTLSPVVSVWLSNVVFGVFGLYVMSKAQT